MCTRSPGASLVVLALLAAATPAAAENPSTVSFGTIPVAPGTASVEIPLRPGLSTEVGLAALGQGTYDDESPFAYLSLYAGAAWLHFDGVPNLRLSAAFQEFRYREVAPLRIPASHEERGVVRARLQQPRGAAALYEMLQLDVRSFDDAGGTHRLVFRPRLRVGQGFNLDAVRIHSLILYQEVALRFAGEGYSARAFEFFRAFAGYMWTTRRGTFVTIGLIGQISLNPPATGYSFLVGPALAITYRFRSGARPETPPPPSDVEVQ